MNPEKQNFCESLVLFRVKNKLTQRKMAELCNLSLAYYTDIENGRREPGKMAKAKINYVFGGNENV